jgi:hypothetical protein
VQNQPAVEVNGTSSVDDLARSKVLGVLGGSRRFRWVVVTAMVLSFAVFVLVGAAGNSPAYVKLGNIVAVALFPLVFVYLLSLMTYREFRNEFAVRKYFRDPVTYVFTEETVHGWDGTSRSGDQELIPAFRWNEGRCDCSEEVL